MAKHYKPYPAPNEPVKQKRSPIPFLIGLPFALGIIVGATAMYRSPVPAIEHHAGNPQELTVWTSDDLKDEGGICGIVVADDLPEKKGETQKWLALTWQPHDHGMSARFDSDTAAWDHVEQYCKD